MKNIARPNNLDLMALRHVSAPCRTFRFVGSRSFSAMGYAIYVVLVPLLSGRVPKKKISFYFNIKRNYRSTRVYTCYRRTIV